MRTLLFRQLTILRMERIDHYQTDGSSILFSEPSILGVENNGHGVNLWIFVV